MRNCLTCRAATGGAIAALLAASLTAAPAPALAQPQAVRPANDVILSAGTGRMVKLDGAMTDVFVSNPGVADVQVRSADQLYVFGKSAGETTVFATDKNGRTVWSANVRVGTNLGSLSEFLKIAMPEAQLEARPINGMVLLTGTVAAPADVEEANRLVQSFVGNGTQLISRIKTATPLQVMLQVKISEVSRTLAKDIGFNLLTRDSSGGFIFGIGRGTPGTIKTHVGSTVDPTSGANPGDTVFGFNGKAGATSLGFAGSLLGLDILSTLDLAENDGRVRTLAEPNLTALSGETASFLAGGEFPVPVAGGINGTSIEFKEYGVSLAFTPTVLEDGRISMRVRPEVSELSSEGSIQLNGFRIPSLTTRRAETTVELGSGQSFMIGGLLRNSATNSTEKAPFLGDLPILGSLFKSNSFRRNETELVIVVTPYLVKPVSAAQIALPTDGYRAPTAVDRVLGGSVDGGSNEPRPAPSVAGTAMVSPGLSDAGGTSQPRPQAPRRERQAQKQAVAPKQAQASAAPGFSF
jgi:pilus assembly protein CpaC